jgi:hypothetical protein
MNQHTRKRCSSLSPKKKQSAITNFADKRPNLQRSPGARTGPLGRGGGRRHQVEIDSRYSKNKRMRLWKMPLIALVLIVAAAHLIPRKWTMERWIIWILMHL